MEEARNGQSLLLSRPLPLPPSYTTMENIGFFPLPPPPPQPSSSSAELQRPSDPYGNHVPEDSTRGCCCCCAVAASALVFCTLLSLSRKIFPLPLFCLPNLFFVVVVCARAAAHTDLLSLSLQLWLPQTAATHTQLWPPETNMQQWRHLSVGSLVGVCCVMMRCDAMEQEMCVCTVQF